MEKKNHNDTAKMPRKLSYAQAAAENASEMRQVRARPAAAPLRHMRELLITVRDGVEREALKAKTPEKIRKKLIAEKPEASKRIQSIKGLSNGNIMLYISSAENGEKLTRKEE